MKLIPVLTAALGILTLSSGLALAEHRGEHRHRQAPSHHGHRGGYVDRGYWRYAQPTDYHRHHLRPPPRGYEWRSYNGSWVLAALATGLIAEIIINGR